eukprot:gnl/MRDRNA2_/MRDRNA2_16362_c0_seq2.p1 gnl/MRDRNA2_/MRDRNA2_16362_c0~~gnl/MRDRNA2_/MRDRNA2_16362_c0_seq2.p1  ORF type:complete len:233 (-),score=35.39 gnl/MRDRNA2_/MRDRNA2_16362_c0_seq2:85-783(-)
MVACAKPDGSRGLCSALSIALCPPMGSLVMPSDSCSSFRKRTKQPKVHFPLNCAAGYDEVRLGMSIFFPTSIKKTCFHGQPQKPPSQAPMLPSQKREDTARVGEESMEVEFANQSVDTSSSRSGSTDSSVSSALTSEEEKASTVVEIPQSVKNLSDSQSCTIGNAIWTAHDPLAGATVTSQRTWSTASSLDMEHCILLGIRIRAASLHKAILYVGAKVEPSADRHLRCKRWY